jgi:hypothetical protein
VPALRRFLKSDPWPYDVRRFVVDGSLYNILYLGVTRVAGKTAIGFSTVRATVGDFSVTGLYLDAVRSLPVRETFDTEGGGCRGSGSIDFGPANAHWLPLTVTVSCTVVRGGPPFIETIRFSNYRFPQAIPPDVFGVLP